MILDWYSKIYIVKRLKVEYLNQVKVFVLVFFLENGEFFLVLIWGFFKFIIIEIIGFFVKKY